MTQETNNNNNKTKEIWFIHGANATPNSFNYLKQGLESDPNFSNCLLVDIKYDCQEKLNSIVQALAASLPKDREVYLVGHSLGGVLGVAISQRAVLFELPCNIKGVFTLSSPFGGSEAADYLKWIYPSYFLFRSISTTNKLITDLKAVGAVVPTTSLVTSGGNNPVVSVANDGVVSVNSQRSLPRAKYVEMPYNHFEVLLSKHTLDHLKAFLVNN